MHLQRSKGIALKFGREMRTPAMQAGAVDGKLNFRGVLTALAAISLFAALLMRVRCRPQDSFSARRWRCNSY